MVAISNSPPFSCAEHCGFGRLVVAMTYSGSQALLRILEDFGILGTVDLIADSSRYCIPISHGN